MNEERPTWDEYFMQIAYSASSRATCPRRSVGAVIVDFANRIVSSGYNGSGPGELHCVDLGCGTVFPSTKCARAIHAEDNALRYSRWWNRRGGKLYTTDLPCFNCASKIVKSGIAEVIYDRDYKKTHDQVLALFEKNGIVCTQAPIGS